MSRVLNQITKYAAANTSMDSFRLQKKITDIFYSAVKAHYSLSLPPELRNLETPSTVDYAKQWATIMPSGRLISNVSSNYS